jgi:5'-methylthioadenosine nucleosidase
LQGAAIGDVFVSTGKMHHDRRIPLPGFDKQGLGYVESTPTPQLQAALQLKAGIVTSGNSLDYTGAQLQACVVS